MINIKSKVERRAAMMHNLLEQYISEHGDRTSDLIEADMTALITEMETTLSSSNPSDGTD